MCLCTLLVASHFWTVSAPVTLPRPADARCAAPGARAFFLVSSDWLWLTCGRSVWRYDWADNFTAPPALYSDLSAFASSEWAVRELRLTATEAALVVLLTRPAPWNASLHEWNVLVLANRNTSSLGALPALYFDFTANASLPALASDNVHLALGPFQFPPFVSGASFLKNLGEQLPYKHVADELRYDGTLPDVRLLPLVELRNGRRKLALPHDLFAFGALRENWPPLLTPRNLLLNALAWTASRDAATGVANYTARFTVLSGQPPTRLSILTSQEGSRGQLKVVYEVQDWPFKSIQSALELVAVMSPQSWSGSNYTSKQTGKTNFYTVRPEPEAFAVKGTPGAPLSSLAYAQRAEAVGADGREWRLAATWALYRDGANYNLVADVPPFPHTASVGVLITATATFPPVVAAPEYHHRLLIAVVTLFVAGVAAFVLAAELWWKKGHPYWPPSFLRRQPVALPRATVSE